MINYGLVFVIAFLIVYICRLLSLRKKGIWVIVILLFWILCFGVFSIIYPSETNNSLIETYFNVWYWITIIFGWIMGYVCADMTNKEIEEYK